jgi:hypothetical protein
MLCAKGWIIEKQQPRFRGVRESYYLVVRRSVAWQARSCCRRCPRSHNGGQFSGTVCNRDETDRPFQAALMTISVAGFGHQVHWEDEEVSIGHRLSFKRAIGIIGTGIFLRVLCPKWIIEWAPTKKIREVRDGFAEFRVCSL